MFTDDEVEAAVQRYLLTEVSTPRLKTGARDIIATKTQAYDLIATSFLLRPASFFYVVWLASNKLMQLLVDQAADVYKLTELAPHAAKRAQSITGVTELVHAEAAIVDLNAALNTRTGGVKGAIGPAINRFKTAVDRFIRDELVKNVVEAGAVVPTGEETRQDLLELWANIQERGADIVERATQLRDGLTNFSATKIPDSTVKGVVARVQARVQELQELLAGPLGPAESRSALLDLFAMRVLLTRCSTFGPPALELTPGAGKTASAVLTGTGTPPQQLGSVAGPYNYLYGAQLTLSVHGTLYVVTLPGSSQAEFRSKTMSSWVAPTAGLDVAITPNYGATSTTTTAAWASGAAAAAALDAALAGIDVFWDSTASQLLFRSQRYADGSALEILSDTVSRSSFVSWLLAAGAPRLFEAQPATVAEVAAAITAGAPGVVATVVAGDVSRRPANITGGATRIGALLRSGSDLTTNGTNTYTVGVNLEALGVTSDSRLIVPGWISARVVEIAGNTVRVGDHLTPISPGLTLAYTLQAADPDTQPQSRVELNSAGAGNRGLYRYVEEDFDNPAFFLDRAPPTTDPTASAVFSFERIHIATTRSDVGASLAVGASPAATALGLTTYTYYASLLALSAPGDDFPAKGVEAGDLIALTDPYGYVRQSDVEIASVAQTVLTVVPADAIPYAPGYWTYRVRSKAGVAYDYYAAALKVSLDHYPDEYRALGEAAKRLVRGSAFSTELMSAVGDYLTRIESMAGDTDGYIVARDVGIDAAVRLMQEGGFDRALDIFLRLDLATFFALGNDAVSYATWVTRQLADSTREVAPVSRDAAPSTQISTAFNNVFDPRASEE